MAKNIVVFSDGTGQEGGSATNTNVYKLFKVIEDRTPRQVAFYDRGLGTGWRKIYGSVGGRGISDNIKGCYRFIFEEFEAGDQVYLFGFSRGAATVRSLANFIHYFGILPKSRPELIDRAYKIYKIRKPMKRKKVADDFVRFNRTMWTRVKFIGCYDTVAALGLPFKTVSAVLDGIPGFRHRFHDFRLTASIENAYHALAIDDERTSFHPVLWESEVLPYQQVRQVWFAGMHTDVGGGYREQSLSDIPLVWLTRQAVAHGLKLYSGQELEVSEDADGLMHNSREGTRKIFRRKVRGWDETRADRPIIHQSVLERCKNQKNQEKLPYQPWILKHDPEVEPWVRFEERPLAPPEGREEAE